MESYDRVRSRVWRGVVREWRLHVATVFTSAVAFVCLAASLLVVTNVSGLRDKYDRVENLTTYMRAGTPTADVARIRDALAATPGVSEARAMRAEEVATRFRSDADNASLKNLPDEVFTPVIEVVLSKDISEDRAQAIIAQMRALSQVEEVETYEGWTRRIASILGAAMAASGVLALIVCAAVFAVIGATVRLVLSRRQAEIRVLELVGATRSYVRRPFVVEGSAHGALGAALALLVVGCIFQLYRSRVDLDVREFWGVGLQFLPLALCVGLVAGGAALGAAAARFGLRQTSVRG